MFRNYLKVAWRSLMKNKTFSFINIFGLSVGLTCCMLITIYLYPEVSYDKYHHNVDQLYQLSTIFTGNGKESKTPNTPAPMAAAMQKEYPEIIATARLMPLFGEDKTLLQYRPANEAPRSCLLYTSPSPRDRQ